MIAYWNHDYEWMGDRLEFLFCPSFTGATNLKATDSSLSGATGDIVGSDPNTCWPVTDKTLFWNQATTTGATHRIDIGINRGIRPTSVAEGITISFWLQATVGNGGVLLGQFANGVPSLGLGTVITSASPLWAFSGGNADFRGVNNQDMSYLRHHVFVAGPSSGAAWWVDGVRRATASIAGTATFGFGLIFAGFNFGNGLGGYLDDLRYYSRAWNAKEIAIAYREGRGAGMIIQPPRRKTYFVPPVSGWKSYWFRNQQRMIGGGIR
jgi:hypothetical protein